SPSPSALLPSASSTVSPTPSVSVAVISSPTPVGAADRASAASAASIVASLSTPFRAVGLVHLCPNVDVDPIVTLGPSGRYLYMMASKYGLVKVTPPCLVFLLCRRGSGEGRVGHRASLCLPVRLVLGTPTRRPPSRSLCVRSALVRAVR